MWRACEAIGIISSGQEVIHDCHNCVTNFMSLDNLDFLAEEGNPNLFKFFLAGMEINGCRK